MAEYTIHTDGLASPNPGTATWAFVRIENGQTRLGDMAALEGRWTNNIAEYQAMIMALKSIDPADTVQVFTDSQLVLKQVTGEWQCNAPGLRHLRDACRDALRQLPNVTLHFVKGSENEADEWTREAFRNATGTEPINYSTWKKRK